jgi:hypothetical protein
VDGEKATKRNFLIFISFQTLPRPSNDKEWGRYQEGYEEKCIEAFDGRIILNWILKKYDYWCRLDLSGV